MKGCQGGIFHIRREMGSALAAGRTSGPRCVFVCLFRGVCGLCLSVFKGLFECVCLCLGAFVGCVCLCLRVLLILFVCVLGCFWVVFICV